MNVNLIFQCRFCPPKLIICLKVIYWLSSRSHYTAYSHLLLPHVKVFIMGRAGPWAMGWAANGSGLDWNFQETNGLLMGLGLNFEIV